MAKIALNIDRLSVEQKVTKGRTALTAAGTTEGVAVLGIPAPAEVADLLAKTDALEAAHNTAQTAANNAKTATAAQHAAELNFNDSYAAYARIGQTKSTGDAVKIGQIGLDVAGTPAPVGEMPQPQNLSITAGDAEGELDAQWDGVRGAKTYDVERSPDPITGTSWGNRLSTTKSKLPITGLTSGSRCWVRVRAMGAAGPGPWSDPAVKTVP